LPGGPGRTLGGMSKVGHKGVAMEFRERSATDTSLGISRHTLSRRGLVVGSVLLWTTPVVRTLSNPASGAGTPVEGISFVAILVRCDGLSYRMKWDVNTTLSLTTGPTFNVPGGNDLQRSNPNLQLGPAPGTSAILNANGSVTVGLGPGCILEDFIVKRGQCNAGPGQAGQPGIGQTGAVTFPVPTSNRASCA
jgi:hypothetical protein